MTTASDLVEETKALLYSGTEPEANQLSANVTAGATSMSFSYDLGSIQRGAVIAIGLEEIRIWATTGTTASVVQRGVNGTTAAAHTSGDYVTVRPRFSDFRVLRAINQDIADLSSPVNGLYQVKTLDVTYNAATQAYDMTSVTSVNKILELRYKQTGPSHYWPSIESYDLFRNMATTEFASGFALSINQGGFPGLPIRVRYGQDFSTLSALTDDVLTVTGLPTSAHDLPPLGAAIKLIGAREIPRNFMESQGDPKRSEEVPPGAILQSIRALQQLRQSRITSEAARLQSDWPRAR